MSSLPPIGGGGWCRTAAHTAAEVRVSETRESELLTPNVRCTMAGDSVLVVAMVSIEKNDFFSVVLKRFAKYSRIYGVLYSEWCQGITRRV